MKQLVLPATLPLSGTLRVPGDKSLSHRAVLFAALAEGTSMLTGVLDSDDVRSTIRACEALGAQVEWIDESRDALTLRVSGWGTHGPRQPSGPVDCGNSGTTARLLMGVVAGFPIEVTLTGDASLSRRPMARVIEPLTWMGASFDCGDGYTLPVTVHGVSRLEPLDYASPVASAQVKTCILLAGLRAEGVTRVSEPSLSRDHTERLLPAFGVEVLTDAEHGASVTGPATLRACDVAVPGDPSSAAFPVVAALLVPGSEVTVEGVSLNPTRTGFVAVLERMGAGVSAVAQGFEGFEPVGTIVARYSPGMSATTVTADEIPSLVDEVPILALAAACAGGTTRFEGIGELRVKESDRLSAVADGLSAFGVRVESGEDWLEVTGPSQLMAAHTDSLGDHRLAMTWAVAGLIAQGETSIERFESVSVSYPRFGEDVSMLFGNRRGLA